MFFSDQAIRRHNTHFLHFSVWIPEGNKVTRMIYMLTFTLLLLVNTVVIGNFTTPNHVAVPGILASKQVDEQ